VQSALGASDRFKRVHVKLFQSGIKNRLYIISAVANYVREKYAQGDTVNALLMSSYPLDAESIEDIKVKLEKKLHKKLKLYLGKDGDLFHSSYYSDALHDMYYMSYHPSSQEEMWTVLS